MPAADRYTPERNRKISEARMGIQYSAETLARMSVASKARMDDPAARLAMSEKLKARHAVNPIGGRPMLALDAVLARIPVGIKLTGEFKGMSVNTEFVCDTCTHLWSAAPANIVRGRGCPRCANRAQYSNLAIKWLDEVVNILGMPVRHQGNGGEHRVNIPNGRGWSHIDGYNEQQGIAFEFHGSHWHSEFDRRRKRYRQTVFKTNALLAQKLAVLYVWESEYNHGYYGTLINPYLGHLKAEDFRSLGFSYQRANAVDYV